MTVYPLSIQPSKQLTQFISCPVDDFGNHTGLPNMRMMLLSCVTALLLMKDLYVYIAPWSADLDRISEGGSVMGTGGHVDVTFYVWGYSYDVSANIDVTILWTDDLQ